MDKGLKYMKIINHVVIGMFTLFLVGGMYSPFYIPPNTFRPIRFNAPRIQPPTSIINRTFIPRPIPLRPIQDSSRINLVIPPPTRVPNINIYYVGPRHDQFRDLINYP